MTKSRRLGALLLLALALGLAVLGQFYFFHRREYLWDGVVFCGLAVACFLFAWRLSLPPRSRTGRRQPWGLAEWLRERPIPAVLVAVGLFSSLVAILLGWDRAPDSSTTDIVIPWLCGIGAFAAAALWPVSWSPRLLRDLKNREGGIGPESWPEMATVAGLVGLALVLRIAALDSVPYTLGGDEAWHGLLARQVLSGELRNPFTMGVMSMPTLFYWPLSWSLRLVGNDMTGLRLPAVLIGSVSVLVLYFFARDLWGRQAAFLSAGFLATYDYHIHYSRLGANNIWDPLFVLLTLWALHRGLAASGEPRGDEEQERGRAHQPVVYRFFLLAGLAMGLSFHFYTGGRLLPLLAAVYVAFFWIQKRRGIERLGLHLVLFFLAFLVAAGPMLGFALSHPNEWNARINQVGIIQSGWLAREPGLTGKSTLQILAEQFLRSAGAFHVFADRTVWYSADRPLLGPLAGVFALLGMAWAVTHWRDRRQFLVLIWFWSVIITGGMLTESPPSSQRLVMAIPAVALLVTTGLQKTVSLGGRLLQVRHKEAKSVALSLLLVALAASSIRFYFVEYTPSRHYGSENGETATMIGYYLRSLDSDYQAYFFGAPRIYWNFGSMTFLAPGVVGQDVVKPLAGPPDFMDVSHNTVFIFLPERAQELAWVEQTYPGGSVAEYRDTSDRLRFTVYDLAR